MAPSKLTAEEELERVEQLRRSISETLAKDSSLCDTDGYLELQETYERYLRARNFDVDEAAKMLVGSLRWRAEYKPTIVTCTFCNERPGYHSWRQVGFDKKGLAVTYSCVAQGKTHSLVPEDCVMHATYLLENLVPTVRQRNASSYVWVLDFTGITMGSCNPRLAAATNRVMARHYPERLGYALIISAPWLFNATWTAMKTFVDPVTVAKVRFVKTHEMKDVFNELFPQDLAQWMEEEILINRNITSSQIKFWEPPAEPGQHDPRGCPSYVREYVEPFVAEREALSQRGLSSSGNMVLRNGSAEPELALGGEANDRNLVTFASKRHLPHPAFAHPPTSRAVQEHLGKLLTRLDAEQGQRKSVQLNSDGGETPVADQGRSFDFGASGSQPSGPVDVDSDAQEDEFASAPGTPTPEDAGPSPSAALVAHLLKPTQESITQL